MLRLKPKPVRQMPRQESTNRNYGIGTLLQKATLWFKLVHTSKLSPQIDCDPKNTSSTVNNQEYIFKHIHDDARFSKDFKIIVSAITLSKMF